VKVRGKLQLTIYILGFLGAALFTLLLIRQGVVQLGLRSRQQVGGIAAVRSFHFVPIFLGFTLVVGALSPRRSSTVAESFLDAMDW
jgi:hypothetical protein